jgi:hypothetical protein
MNHEKAAVVLARAKAQEDIEELRVAIEAFREGNLGKKQEILEALRARIRIQRNQPRRLILLMDKGQGVVLRNLLTRELGFENKRTRDNFLKIIQKEGNFDSVDVEEGDRSAVRGEQPSFQNGGGNGGGGGSKDEGPDSHAIAGSEEPNGRDQGQRRRGGLVRLLGLREGRRVHNGNRALRNGKNRRRSARAVSRTGGNGGGAELQRHVFHETKHQFGTQGDVGAQQKREERKKLCRDELHAFIKRTAYGKHYVDPDDKLKRLFRRNDEDAIEVEAIEGNWVLLDDLLNQPPYHKLKDLVGYQRFLMAEIEKLLI